MALVSANGVRFAHCGSAAGMKPGAVGRHRPTAVLPSSMTFASQPSFARSAMIFAATAAPSAIPSVLPWPLGIAPSPEASAASNVAFWAG